ncbi:MAG TPA: hypothetical protein VLZ83_00145 [Edaphocola sp.]|nr:hypothetical protein [Edaphocola sp.]
MNKLLYTLSIIMMFFSCTQLPQTEKELRENINKTAHLNLFETVQQANSLLSYKDFRNQNKNLSLVYLQNSCNPCYPKFIEWQQKMDSINTPNDYTVLFIINGDSYNEFMTHVLDIEYVEDKFYVIMDPEGKFLEQNKDIPRWIIDAGILIDAENKIKMVGAPWLNEDMTKLFYKTISSEQ